MERVSLEMCRSFGFTNAALLDPQALSFLPEVREMCAANRCRRYGKTWSCPPAIGSVESFAERARTYAYGVLLQYTATLADDFDVETMQSAEQACKDALDALRAALVAQHRSLFVLSVGACTRCDACTYPDAPCRFPDLLAPSMEACGLLVSRVCEQCGVPYYYGKQTITFVCAILLRDAEEVPNETV